MNRLIGTITISIWLDGVKISEYSREQYSKKIGDNVAEDFNIRPWERNYGAVMECFENNSLKNIGCPPNTGTPLMSR